MQTSRNMKPLFVAAATLLAANAMVSGDAAAQVLSSAGELAREAAALAGEVNQFVAGVRAA